MAIVNKFNVNNKQVTLDADIIENMSANDVSYDDSTQYNENTVGDKLSELEQKQMLGSIYDVTVNNDGATFASLSELLSSENLSTLIPVAVRYGGMSIRFVQSSDNKYVQYRLMAKQWSINPADWVDVESYVSEIILSTTPRWTAEIEQSTPSTEDYPNIRFEIGKRYTFVPYVTSGIIDKAMIVDGSTTAQSVSIKYVKAETLTATMIGWLRLVPFTKNLKATVYIFDTTDNDELKEYLETYGYFSVNSFRFKEQAKTEIENVVNRMDGSLFQLNPLVGTVITPDYTAQFVSSSTSKDYTDCLFIQGHRYTFVPRVTSGLLYLTYIVSNSTIQSTNIKDTITANSIIANISGYLRLIAWSVPINSTVYIFDTTDNDELKEYLEIYGYKAVNQLKVSEDLENSISILTGNYWNKIIFIGDSQTQRRTFVNKFKALYSIPNDVDDYGYGGAGADEITGVQGGISLFVNPFTIPADTTPVQIEVTSDVGNMLIGQQNQKGLNNVNISGVKGNISFSNGHNYFTRASAGDLVEVSRPIKLRTELNTRHHYFAIIEIGTNDYRSGSVELLSEKIINDADSMIKHNGNTFYFVLGLTAKSNVISIPDVNKKLARHFGERFIDIRTYMINYGLQDEGITPTAQDLTDIESGEIPSSLRSDNVHFNQNGGNVIGTLIYNRGVSLGFWE